MSEAVNPYQSPETAVVPENTLVAQGTLTETMLFYLKATAPWLRFIGILGFVGTGLTVLWGIASVAIFPIWGEAWGELSQISAALGGAALLLFFGAAALIIIPSLFLYRAGEKIRNYIRTGMDQDLELALKNNKSFWKFYGIVCIVYLAFLPLMIIVAIVAGVASAF